VLFDTLINDMTTEELVAVLAHEIGHYKKKHTLKMLAFSVVEMLLVFYILGLFLKYDEVSLAL
jgi:STE24 endopeptidase